MGHSWQFAGSVAGLSLAIPLLLSGCGGEDAADNLISLTSTSRSVASATIVVASTPTTTVGVSASSTLSGTSLRTFATSASTTFTSTSATTEKVVPKIGGSVGIKVDNPMEFLRNETAKQALIQGIADAHQVDAEYVHATFTVQRRLGSLRGAHSTEALSFRVDYTIVVPASKPVIEFQRVVDIAETVTLQKMALAVDQRMQETHSPVVVEVVYSLEPIIITTTRMTTTTTTSTSTTTSTTTMYAGATIVTKTTSTTTTSTIASMTTTTTTTITTTAITTTATAVITTTITSTTTNPTTVSTSTTTTLATTTTSTPTTSTATITTTNNTHTTTTTTSTRIATTTSTSTTTTTHIVTTKTTARTTTSTTTISTSATTTYTATKTIATTTISMAATTSTTSTTTTSTSTSTSTTPISTSTSTTTPRTTTSTITTITTTIMITSATTISTSATTTTTTTSIVTTKMTTSTTTSTTIASTSTSTTIVKTTTSTTTTTTHTTTTTSMSTAATTLKTTTLTRTTTRTTSTTTTTTSTTTTTNTSTTTTTTSAITTSTKTTTTTITNTTTTSPEKDENIDARWNPTSEVIDENGLLRYSDCDLADECALVAIERGKLSDDSGLFVKRSPDNVVRELRFDIKNTVAGEKVRLEATTCFVTNATLRRHSIDPSSEKVAKEKFLHTIDHHCDGGPRAASANIPIEQNITYLMKIPENFPENAKGIFGQFHGRPDKRIFQDPQGNVHRFNSTMAVAACSNNGAKCKKGTVSGGDYDGWRYKQGGYPPLTFAYMPADEKNENGTWFVMARSDNRIFVPKSDCSMSPLSRQWPDGKVCPGGENQTVVGLWKAPFSSLPRGEWLELRWGIRWSAYAADGGKTLSDGLVDFRISSRDRVFADVHWVGPLGRHDDGLAPYFKLGVYNPSGSTVPLSISFANFSQSWRELPSL